METIILILPNKQFVEITYMFYQEIIFYWIVSSQGIQHLLYGHTLMISGITHASVSHLIGMQLTL